MLNVSKINGTENIYAPNKKISFQSKFVPNDALKLAFESADSYDVECVKTFINIIEHLLNDGKDDVIKLTKTKIGSMLLINGKRVNYYKRCAYKHENPLFNIFDYFYHRQKIGKDANKLNYDEFKAVKADIDTLNADLNADDITKNPDILNNLQKNMDKINDNLRKHARDKLEKLETKGRK